MKELWKTPEKILSLDDVGELHLQWMIEYFAAERLIQRLPIFDKAVEVMTERGNFSRKNAFGEMHGDCYMWIEKADCPVICYEDQNNRLLFIKSNSCKFYIRQLAYGANIYNWGRSFSNCKLSTFRTTGFKQCDENPAFRYGDSRDSGDRCSAGLFGMPVASLEELEELGIPAKFHLPNNEMNKVDNADFHTFYALKLMDYWEPYLDNPDELE